MNNVIHLDSLSSDQYHRMVAAGWRQCQCTPGFLLWGSDAHLPSCIEVVVLEDEFTITCWKCDAHILAHMDDEPDQCTCCGSELSTED